MDMAHTKAHPRKSAAVATADQEHVPLLSISTECCQDLCTPQPHHKFSSGQAAYSSVQYWPSAECSVDQQSSSHGHGQQQIASSLLPEGAQDGTQPQSASFSLPEQAQAPTQAQSASSSLPEHASHGLDSPSHAIYHQRGDVSFDHMFQLSEEPPEAQARHRVASINDFSCQRPDGKLLFQDLSFQVQAGQPCTTDLRLGVSEPIWFWHAVECNGLQ